MLYFYQAKDPTGRTVTGELDASDERRAAQEIRDRGFFPMRVSAHPVGTAYSASRLFPSYQTARSTTSPFRKLLTRFIFPLWPGVGPRDLALFYRQFSAMLNAGVPITQCLGTLYRQTGNGVLRKQIGKISARILEGGLLTEAMGEYPWVFTEFHLAMIAAGEQSGRLDVMMSRLADALEQENSLRNAIKRETWYPCVTLVASFLLPPLVLLVVNHDTRGYFQEALLPLLEFGTLAFGIFFLTRLFAQFKVGYDWLIASLPGIGGAVRMIGLARFARALASLYAAGISIPNALRSAAMATGNGFLAKRLISAVPAIQDGRGMTEALGKTKIIPPMMLSMLGTGEQTGDLDAAMNKVAEFYEQEAALRLHQLSVSLGAVAMIFAGVRVATTVGNFYTGYFNKILDQANPDSP